MSGPNSSNTDCTDATFGESSVRVDNVGRGYDIYIRTHEGHLSHIFFVDDFTDVDGYPDSSQIRFWQVTRSR